jgi:hypothetical protein
MAQRHSRLAGNAQILPWLKESSGYINLTQQPLGR